MKALIKELIRHAAWFSKLAPASVAWLVEWWHIIAPNCIVDRTGMDSPTLTVSCWCFAFISTFKATLKGGLCFIASNDFQYLPCHRFLSYRETLEVKQNRMSKSVPNSTLKPFQSKNRFRILLYIHLFGKLLYFN